MNNAVKFVVVATMTPADRWGNCLAGISILRTKDGEIRSGKVETRENGIQIARLFAGGDITPVYSPELIVFEREMIRKEYHHYFSNKPFFTHPSDIRLVFDGIRG